MDENFLDTSPLLVELTGVNSELCKHCHVCAVLPHIGSYICLPLPGSEHLDGRDGVHSELEAIQRQVSLMF